MACLHCHTPFHIKKGQNGTLFLEKMNGTTDLKLGVTESREKKLQEFCSCVVSKEV